MDKIKPMLAKDGGQAVNSPNLLWEQKYDGARILSFVNGAYRLQARTGTNKTATFPELHLQTNLPVILDGEIVLTSGLSFQDSIQSRVNRQNNISFGVKAYPAKLMVLNILEVDGKNVEALPLIDRKDLLAQVLVPTDNVELAPYTDDGETLFTQTKAAQLEGIVGKHKHGKYLRDKREWLKVKYWQLGTFMAVGYTAGTGWRVSTFGALVLADTKGKYVGEVGTGLTDTIISDLMKMFSRGVCPFSREPEPATWIKPFAIKVRYLELTNLGVLRFPSFKGVV